MYAIISTVLSRSTRDVLLKHCSRRAAYALKKRVSSLLIFTAAVLSIKAVKLRVCLTVLPHWLVFHVDSILYDCFF